MSWAGDRQGGATGSGAYGAMHGGAGESIEDAAEQALPGGLGSGGAVVRMGATVRRPWRAHSPAVQALLRHLADVGFDGAPRVLGVDDRGREVLSYLEGDVAIPPLPAWAASDELLVSVAELQRRMHVAAATFVPPPAAHWDRANLAPPMPGAIVCHNDLCVENVVVVDGRAVGFIDFDFAAPNDPLIDVAIAARHWVPLRDPIDVAEAWQGIDQPSRFAAFCDAHGLDVGARRDVVAAGLDFLDRALVSMRTRAEAGQPGYVEAWASGYEAQNRRSHAWLATTGPHLVAR